MTLIILAFGLFMLKCKEKTELRVWFNTLQDQIREN